MSDRADIFDRIAASSPANATAAKVTSRGTHYEPSFRPARETFDAPPPMKPVPAMDNNRGLIGATFGRLTVIGLRAENNPKKKSAWVVRCVCGAYEVRKAVSIRAANPDACCQRCAAVQRHRKNYARLGSRPIEDFTGGGA